MMLVQVTPLYQKNNKNETQNSAFGMFYMKKKNATLNETEAELELE